MRRWVGVFEDIIKLSAQCLELQGFARIASPMRSAQLLEALINQGFHEKIGKVDLPRDRPNDIFKID